MSIRSAQSSLMLSFPLCKMKVWVSVHCNGISNTGVFTVHEGILSSALSTIGLWAARFSVAVSDNLINLFKVDALCESGFLLTDLMFVCTAENRREEADVWSQSGLPRLHGARFERQFTVPRDRAHSQASNSMSPAPQRMIRLREDCFFF